MKTILEPATITWIEKKSKFIGIGIPCASIESFRLQWDQYKVQFKDANHVTFAYRILESGMVQARFSDDGEPSGTAGKPIYNHLEGQNLINFAIFVVRYFGGIKLGSGGLVKAYSHSARLTLESANVVPFVAYQNLTATIPYSAESQIRHIARQFQANISHIGYGAALEVQLEVPESEIQGIRKALKDINDLSSDNDQ